VENAVRRLASLLILITLSSATATADPVSWCNEFKDPARQIRGCTEFIRRSKLPGENLAVAYTNRGIALASLRQTKRALADFNEAIRLAPQSPFPYYNRANSYYDQKEYKQAIADYDVAIELQSDFALAYYNRGLAYEKLGERAKSIEDFEKALELDPGSQAAKDRLNRLRATQ
jgi:tetratricopeptide (TPR) repeat protein